MRSTPHLIRLAAARLLLGLAFAALAVPALAQRVEGSRPEARGLYAAEVPVNSQAAGDRSRGFARALGEVLGKLSGDRNIASSEGVAAALSRAADYVDGYDYRQDEGTSSAGAPTFQTTLVVRFDEQGVDDLAAALGIPVWPTPRPRPVLWLAIDDGSGPRLVGENHESVASPLTARAVERGYRLGLPAGSAAERAVVGAIWRGDTAAVALASARYTPPMQLVGKLYRQGSGWRADWIFVDDGRVLSSWSAEERDARQALAAGADGAADALAARYAQAPESEPAGNFTITFSGIDGNDDYLRLSAWLQGLAVVSDITPLRATGDALELELALGSGLAGFARIAERSEFLVAVDGAADTAADGTTASPRPTHYRIR